MTTRIQILLIVGTILFFIALLRVIRKDKLSSDMACFWIVLSLILGILALFPQLAIGFGKAVGIISSINAIYLVLIFLLLCFVFFFFVKSSELEKKLNNLIQRYALDEEEKKKSK